LQDEHKRMLEGRDIALIHNHPNNTAASQADLEGAFWLGAKSLTVVTPSGYRYVYIRGTRGMELAAVINDPNYVANPSWREDVESSTAFWTQTLAEKGNQPEWVMRQEDELRETGYGFYKSVGLTVEQVDKLYNDDIEEDRLNRIKPWSRYLISYEQAWKNRWMGHPTGWYDYDAIDTVMPTIKDVAERWNHPALGMSDDEVAALITANLHREAHYRRVNPSIDRMPTNRILWNFGDIFINYVKNLLSSDPSVGPANLRVTVADEILGARKIPMPGQGETDFYDMGRLDELEQEWQNLDEAGRRDFLEDDMNAIELMGANLYRGAERLYQQYLKDQEVLEDYLQHQRLLAQGAVERYRQERGFPHEFLEQAGRQQRYLEEYLQQAEDRATMFNMSAWMSQGIAESSDLRNALDNKAVTAAINHARETVPFVSGILSNNAFGLSTDQDGYIMFNEDDLHAYLRD